MKKLITMLFLAGLVLRVLGQPAPSAPENADIDSLKREWALTNNDTLRLVLANQLRYEYFFENGNADSALVYSKQVLALARKLGYKIDEAYACDLIGDILNYQHHQNTLETFFRGVKIAENPQAEAKILPRKYLERMTYWHPNLTSLLAKNNWEPRYFRLAILSSLYQDLGHAYGKVMPNQQRLMFYISRAIELCKAQKDSLGLAFSYTVAAEYFFETGQLDSSLFYAQQSYAVLTGYKDKQHISELQQSSTLALMGAVYLKKGNNEEAVRLLRHSIDIGLKYQLQTNHWLAYATLSEYFLKTGAVDSSLYYAIEAHETAQKTALPEELQKTSALLAALYKKTGAKDSALKYYELAAALSNSVNNAIKKQKLQSQDFEEQVQQQELQERKAKEKVHLLIVGLGLSLLIALFLFWNNRQRKKTNTVLHQKNLQIEHTLNELKATQAQLVQREKMASLGELTAGIAHEIQNPLNFVNNFSEVNTELITELKQELAQGNMDESKSLASDIEENEQKINLHGKRADAIVKGMLQHSRKNIGEKQPTDINVLTDEYLRLSFHGMRAKDKSFNATMQTSFDESIGKANIVPQDIGRVLLNLFNNAFYAVNEKKKQQSEDYEPTVLVNTKKLADKIEVRVQDNGMGISKSLVDKIFQPFFTTKPTGQGTGLGLSLSYDIIKAHGGNISVVSEEGVGTTFVVQMPVA